MDPVTTLIAARVGMNLLNNITGGLGKIGQPAAPAGQAAAGGTAPTDPLAFQKMLQQVAASPKVQNAARLESAGIHGMHDVPLKMGDFAARIMQDPGVQDFLQGESKPSEIRFMGDGVVSLRTQDGRSRTIRLESHDARSAALHAEDIVKSLRDTGAITSSQAPGLNAQDNALFSLRYRIGDGAAELSA